jgi:hypothetical protein
MGDAIRKIEEAKAAAISEMRFASAAERQQIMAHFQTAIVFLQGYIAALSDAGPNLSSYKGPRELPGG